MHFEKFDADMFLREYWQQKPLLIRNPWAAWVNPLEPDELAGLACEAEVESRLIEQPQGRLSGGLRAENGPFSEKRFSKLGTDRWTLLVQAVDHFVPAVAALLAPFRFIPNWRIDDVMVSLAADKGGVGPHFDQYDVFLIQGLGRRHWQVGAKCDDMTALLPHDELRLLAEFYATDEWVLEPGDILYVPPGISHNGVAVGDDCMTYSIGFRAPSRADLIGNYCDDLLDKFSDDDRYGDAGLSRQENPGEITAAALDALHTMITEHLGDRAAFARWFGGYNSLPKYPDIDWTPEQPITIAELRERLGDGETLVRNPASRFSYIDGAHDSVAFFADGAIFECAGPVAIVAKMISAQDCFTIEPELLKSDATLAIIAALFNQGSVTFDEAE